MGIHFDRKKITKLREGLGYSQAEFAKELGHSRQLVNNWETGKNVPLVTSLADMANAFNVDRIDLFFTKQISCMNDVAQ